MTRERRIILNVITTYGRTLLGVSCGIFSVRWVLMALGQESYGLFGVVGSLVFFITFFNIQFSAALSRFYAFSIGKASVANDDGTALEECRAWFSTGILIHLALPTVLMTVGYPLGHYAITHGWLNIPVERYGVCVWLWRFVCTSCFIGMASVPFGAMYGAKQYIAELTIYSMIQVVVRTGFIYYMTTVPRDWLFGYGLATTIIGLAPQVIIIPRAFFVFPECRIRLRAMLNRMRIAKIGIYAWWQMVGSLGYLARHQCMEIVVNKFFGPKVNAAYTVAGTASAEAASLTGALNAAFIPAITTAYGAGDLEYMKALVYRVCKFGTLLILPFAIPLGLEVDEVLELWLKTPPCYANGLCIGMLFVIVIEKMTLGHTAAVNASGNIAKFQVARSLTCVLALPLAVGVLWIYPNVYVVAGVMILSAAIMVVTDVVLSRRIGLSVRVWLQNAVVPTFFVSVISVAIGVLPVLFMSRSFVRMVLTSFVVEVVLLPLAWLFVMSATERDYVIAAIKKRFRR